MTWAILDMFSGIGAFSLGLQRAGMKPIAFVEIDQFCRDVLARHWPGVPIHHDVRDADFPAADVICGGFPCQDVSRAGKRAGVTGQRSGLYRELVRAIRMVRPKVAIVENVAALLDDGIDIVLGDLAEGGDCVEWDCVPANAIGACHERDRVWIVAHANGGREPDGWTQPVRRGIKGQGQGQGFGVDADTEGGGWSEGRGRPEGEAPGRQTGTERSHDADAESNGCGQGRPRRPPDSFAWIRDATRWHAGHAYRAGFPEREGERDDPRQERQAAERAAIADVWQQEWPCEPALLGVDDGIADRVERTRALGNSLIPQIPELIGRAILDQSS